MAETPTRMRSACSGACGSGRTAVSLCRRVSCNPPLATVPVKCVRMCLKSGRGEDEAVPKRAEQATWMRSDVNRCMR